MTSETLPALFVSHGAPTLLIEDHPARDFLAALGTTLPRPDAILAISAHWTTGRPLLSAAARPETVHDFGGFPEALYRLRYPAPGSPALAERAATLLAAAGLDAGLDPRRGLDHGAWVPLMLAYPAADIPVVQLSVQPGRDPAHHLDLGAALHPLRAERVLILASGSATHDVASYFSTGSQAAEPDWVSGFADWMAACIAALDTASLLAYRATAPAAVRNHPSEEHLLPLFVALGAATPGIPGRPIHVSCDRVLRMDAYRFD